MAHGLTRKTTTDTALGEIRQAKAMPAVSAPRIGWGGRQGTCGARGEER